MFTNFHRLDVIEITDVFITRYDNEILILFSFIAVKINVFSILCSRFIIVYSDSFL